MNPKPNTIHGRIRRLRETKGISADDAAVAIGIKRPTLSNIENGKDLPGRATLRAIADYYEVSVDWLESGRGPSPEEVSLVEAYRSLGKDQQSAVLEFLKNLSPKRQS